MTREPLRLLDLPWDLVLDILFRVPAKSLGRLSFTCKRWNALFKDHEFIKKHLDKAAAKESMVLLSSDSHPKKVYSVNLNLHGIHDNFVNPKKLLNLKKFHIPKQLKIYNIFHCDGLLLCRAWNRRLVIWNPCTRQLRWIPLCTGYKEHYEFALGYENNKSCQTYKILRSSWDFYAAVPQDVDCGIYDFESHTWKDLIGVFPSNCRRLLSKAVSLKGNIYWVANINDEEDILLSFDFSTEKYRCLPISFASADVYFVPTTISVVREERLAVLYSSFSHPTKIEIWMTTHDKIDHARAVSWSKFLSLELDENNPQIDISCDITFSIDEEKKAAMICDVDYFAKKEMVIVGEDNRFMKIPNVSGPVIYNYVPSLVQIQQGGVMTRGRKRKNRH